MFEFNTSAQFQLVFDACQAAYKLAFDLEEHECGICAKYLLGDKFIFLSGCEHLFCLECMTTDVTNKINCGKISDICCANEDCKKLLNELDMKGLGLD